MAGMIFGLCLLVVVAALVGFGVLIGKSYAEHNEVQPTRRSDVAAASCAIQRLANEGKIDEELRAQLFELLHELLVPHVEVPVPKRVQAIESPPRPLPEVPVPTAPAPAEEPAVASVRIDEEAPVAAEIVEAAPAPPIAVRNCSTARRLRSSRPSMRRSFST